MSSEVNMVPKIIIKKQVKELIDKLENIDFKSRVDKQKVKQVIKYLYQLLDDIEKAKQGKAEISIFD